MRHAFLIIFFLLFLIQGALTWFDQQWALSFAVTLPVFLLGIYDMNQKRHTIKATYPLVGRFRYWMEVLRPKIYQYFIESDTDGAPISRIFRSVVYQRSKGDVDTVPFGTQLDVYAEGYEWINHSLYPKHIESESEVMRVQVGRKETTKPYSLSLLNVSAMSYGALSKNAIMALNKGAQMGGFAHNTGEGGVSHYHLKHGGDLIWQVGTGYFGCRDKEGHFSPKNFKKQAENPSVKMIEIKLSQGAKPGHGGILPARKNNQEIAKIRQVEPHTRVVSPPAHSAFSNSSEMLDFIYQLRELSGGKPIGIKLCIGGPEELSELVQTMKKRQMFPDFITIDGGEGGTGAAPIEFSNSIGTPLMDGLVLIDNMLKNYGIRNEMKIIASGKIITGFHMARAISLGADACYSARAMMLALGCIQALECNTNHCPTGIATTDPQLYVALDVENKSKRVMKFQMETIKSFADILGSAGLSHPSLLKRGHIMRRVSQTKTLSFEEIYPGPNRESQSIKLTS